MTASVFDDSVFINCPFDQAYSEILRAVLFTTISLGLRPRIALERSDSGEPRISKILQLIGESKYAIHDLSRLRAEAAGEFYRLNMAFELGLDVGCRRFGTQSLTGKRCLILEAKQYDYQAALSDLAGSDIAAHDNQPQRAMVEVRNWLAMQCRPRAPGAGLLWDAFNAFTAWHRRALKRRGFSDEDQLRPHVPELINSMMVWTRRLSRSAIMRAQRARACQSLARRPSTSRISAMRPSPISVAPA